MWTASSSKVRLIFIKVKKYYNKHKRYPKKISLLIIKRFKKMSTYIPKEQNVIQEILHDHYQDFKDRYDDEYSKDYAWS